MGQLFICDICGLPMKPNEDKYVLALEKIRNEDENYRNGLEYLNSIVKRYQEIKSKEICCRCKDILDYFFNLRKKEIAILNQNISNIDNEEKEEPKYCMCSYPEPTWDEFPIIKCKKCGKVINPYINPSETGGIDGDK